MVMDMEDRLIDCYSVFEGDHERRRAQLMDSLPQRQSEPMVSGRSVRFSVMSHWTRKALAAAAVLFIVAGLSLVINQSTPMNHQAAWASAVDNAGRVESVHLRTTTGSSWLEMWWRRPNDFRMEFSNGNIITHNGKARCNYNGQSNTLVKSPGSSMVGFEMFVLGELGQIFTSNHRLSEQLMKNSTLISTKDVIYKGEKCRELTLVKDAKKGTLFVSVVDAKENFIYDMKMYDKSHPEKILYHIEVLDVDQMMPDSLFELEAQPGQRVVDRK